MFMTQHTFIDTLKEAARDAGATERQAGNFLLWVGNELFEGRIPGSAKVMEMRAKEMAERFMREISQRNK